MTWARCPHLPRCIITPPASLYLRIHTHAHPILVTHKITHTNTHSARARLHALTSLNCARSSTEAPKSPTNPHTTRTAASLGLVRIVRIVRPNNITHTLNTRKHNARVRICTCKILALSLYEYCLTCTYAAGVCVCARAAALCVQTEHACRARASAQVAEFSRDVCNRFIIRRNPTDAHS